MADWYFNKRTAVIACNDHIDQMVHLFAKTRANVTALKGGSGARTRLVTSRLLGKRQA